MRIILGSESPRRLEIAQGVAPEGAAVEAIPSGFDEKSIRKPTPTMLTLAIALAKNGVVAGRVSGDAVIITADTVVTCNKVVREKPRDTPQLQHWLETNHRQPVVVITSVCVRRLKSGWVGSATDTATVSFNQFSVADIAAILKDPVFRGAAGGFIVGHPLMREHILSITGGPDARDTVDGLPGRITHKLIRDAMAAE